jgi:ATP-dependent protease ClpP protease subunit
MPTTQQPLRAAKPCWYAISNKDSNEAEIRIYEDIGLFGISAKQFADDLEKISAQTIRVRLNTYGGEAFDGIAIYNALRAHPAEIIVQVDGIAASAGSIIAMSGDEIRMADNAFLMIHEANGGVFGEAGDMRKYADTLDKLNDSIASTYQMRAGKTRKYWRDKMAEESWFTAEEAKAEKLIDAIDDRESAAKNRFDFRIYNQVQHVPDKVREIWGAPQNKNAPEVSPMVGEPPPAVLTETSQMAEAIATPTQAAPAQDPAAGNAAIPQGTFATVQEAIANFKSVQGPQFFEQGKRKGAEEAVQAYNLRIKEIAESCPGKPEMALNAILNGQSPDAVRLAFNATAEAERKALADAQAKEMRIVQLESLLAIGGHPGVAMALNDSATPADEVYRREPKAQAEWEWDNQPLVRKTASSKEIYVLARTAELNGTHRSFSREPANA